MESKHASCQGVHHIIAGGFKNNVPYKVCRKRPVFRKHSIKLRKFLFIRHFSENKKVSYFDVFPNQQGEEIPFEPQYFVSGRIAKNKDTEQLHICLGYPGIESNCDDIYPLSVFNNALGGGMSSRLFQRIREELGMAYSVYSYASSYRGVGSFNIYAGTNPENGETVIRELQEQMALFLKEGMTDKEFRSAKAQLRGGFLLGLESSSGRMQSLGRGMLLFSKTRSPEEVIAKIDAVTLDSTMELARRLLNCDPSAAIVGKNAKKYLDFIGGSQNG